MRFVQAVFLAKVRCLHFKRILIKIWYHAICAGCFSGPSSRPSFWAVFPLAPYCKICDNGQVSMSDMIGRIKLCTASTSCFPIQRLRNFPKALYGTTGGTCSEWFISSFHLYTYKNYAIFGVTFSLKFRLNLIISIKRKFRGCIMFSAGQLVFAGGQNSLNQTFEILSSAWPLMKPLKSSQSETIITYLLITMW